MKKDLLNALRIRADFRSDKKSSEPELIRYRKVSWQGRNIKASASETPCEVVQKNAQNKHEQKKTSATWIKKLQNKIREMPVNLSINILSLLTFAKGNNASRKSSLDSMMNIGNISSEETDYNNPAVSGRERKEGDLQSILQIKTMDSCRHEDFIYQAGMTTDSTDSNGQKSIDKKQFSSIFDSIKSKTAVLTFAARGKNKGFSEHIALVVKNSDTPGDYSYLSPKVSYSGGSVDGIKQGIQALLLSGTKILYDTIEEDFENSLSSVTFMDNKQVDSKTLKENIDQVKNKAEPFHLLSNNCVQHTAKVLIKSLARNATVLDSSDINKPFYAPADLGRILPDLAEDAIEIARQIQETYIIQPDDD